MKFTKPISRFFTVSSPAAPLKRPNPTNPPLSIRELHAHLIRNHLHTDPSSIFTVLRSYSLNPLNLTKAHNIFNQIQLPATSNWNLMIRAFSQSDQPIEAIRGYHHMRIQGVGLDNLTFIFVFKACARVSDVLNGRKVHLHAMKIGFGSHLFVCNALIHMYASCKELGFAHKVFDEMPERDLVSWNSLICGYSQSSRFRDVLRLFGVMQKENVKADAVTMVKTVLACSQLGDEQVANSMVEYIESNNVEIDVYLGNTLIDLYGRHGSEELARSVFDQMQEKNVVSWNTMIIAHVKVGNLDAARKLFDEMPVRDVISWTSMITGYTQTSRFTDSLILFQEMMKAKVRPDKVAITTVLSACAHLGTFDIGSGIHDYIRKNNIKSDIHLGNALIDMYCKCGRITKALEVFQEMEKRDTVTWSSIINGLSVNGYANDAVKFFSQMLSEGVRPSDVTFIGVLSGCSHAGLVDEGLEYFESMTNVHQLEPKMKHYGCVVDLLSRSGNLEKAYEFIENMPIAPDNCVWRILLSASKLYENVNMAEIALKKLIESDPTNSGNYVLVSNIYSITDRWDDAAKIRALMKEKAPGGSSIEVNR